MSLERFREDFRGFADKTDYSVAGVGPESALVRRLNNGRSNITSKVSLRMLALVLCWRVACWDRSVSLVITPSVEAARALMAEAFTLTTTAEAEVRAAIHFHPRKVAMSNPKGLELGAVHAFSGSMGLDLPVTNEPFTVMLPDYDSIPGPHLTYLGKLLSRPGTTLISNFVR